MKACAYCGKGDREIDAAMRCDVCHSIYERLHEAFDALSTLSKLRIAMTFVRDFQTQNQEIVDCTQAPDVDAALSNLFSKILHSVTYLRGGGVEALLAWYARNHRVSGPQL